MYKSLSGLLLPLLFTPWYVGVGAVEPVLASGTDPVDTGAVSKLHVVVTGAENSRGKIVLALFDNEDDFTKKPYREQIIDADNAGSGAIFSRLADGDYAVVIFHDENANELLDRNFLGVPEEGVAFSNNLQVKFSLPGFDDAKVSVRGDTAISIKLHYL
ncbi:DUF2141 domain-containing protein [Thalassomonas actiniarum]|uniref:DUF2141 domain-containing protein n=1 Tax=Thalassomonas actiniarum TaxID=485447 RepID=A0AAE9YUX9_9GAMM|nr:DUF2141 domain-containing protein [Thalassomonas actiniarum]WDE01596.1 DUF2141 domain-containing protein [Thalassomonas actiniarum]